MKKEVHASCEYKLQWYSFIHVHVNDEIQIFSVVIVIGLLHGIFNISLVLFPRFEGFVYSYLLYR